MLDNCWSVALPSQVLLHRSIGLELPLFLIVIKFSRFRCPCKKKLTKLSSTDNWIFHWKTMSNMFTPTSPSSTIPNGKVFSPTTANKENHIDELFQLDNHRIQSQLDVSVNNLSMDWKGSIPFHSVLLGTRPVGSVPGLFSLSCHWRKISQPSLLACLSHGYIRVQ